MYYGNLKKNTFQPDPAALHHEKEREAYIRQLSEALPAAGCPAPSDPAENVPVPAKQETLSELLARVCPEDGALIALILFLLCDNTENDVVLLGILLYVLLSA